MLAKGQRIIFIYFFVIERSDTILIEKSHYFVAFLEYVYTYPLLASLLKKTGKQRVCVHKPQKVHLAHFCLGVPKTLYI